METGRAGIGIAKRTSCRFESELSAGMVGVAGERTFPGGVDDLNEHKKAESIECRGFGCEKFHKWMCLWLEGEVTSSKS
jgi:hypothetical protein